MEGIVKFFDEQKGYGIVEIEGGQSYFFTAPAIIGETVIKSDPVSFELADDPRRSDELMAINVQRTASAPDIDPCRVFVANLPRGVSQRDLHDTFERIAPVSRVDLVLDRETGEQRGFAFITMQTEAGAREVIAKLAGADWSGRRITVKRAISKALSKAEQRA